MSDNVTEDYQNAATAAREAAQRAREAAQEFDTLAERLLAGDVKQASEAHQKAMSSFEQAKEAVAACDDWLIGSSEPS
jgi:hypothetical protein